jgi:alkylation response protein AidB-like acyl-CoA dehydrogenase
MPVAEVQIHDNWQVMGLQGTGSCDFSVTDLFVPERFSWDAQRARPQRGGPLYRLGMPAFVANEHVAFALGVGRRALDALLDLAQAKQRGYGSVSPLAARPALQRAVGEGALRLRAVRALAIECYEPAWAIVGAGQTAPTSRTSRTAECRDLSDGGRCGRDDVGVSLPWRDRPVHDACAPAVSARHQCRDATPDGE